MISQSLNLDEINSVAAQPGGLSQYKDAVLPV